MRFLFYLARTAAGRLCISWIFVHMNFAIPVKRLRETETLLAFHHPRPSYALHILIVPKRALSGLADLTPADADFTADLFQTAQSLVVQFNLDQVGYRLITNGGRYQDIPHLHFHLISERAEEQG